MDVPWLEIAGAAAAGLSATAAVGSWRAARQANATSTRAHSTAEEAHQTATVVARIERERWLVDRTPNLMLALIHLGGGRFNLSVHLNGPDSLGDLDSIWIEVVNDDWDHRVLNPTPEFTQADSDAHIWGPFRFSPGIDGADRQGRTTSSVPLEMGKGRPFAMERTRRGHWMTGMNDEQWQARYVDSTRPLPRDLSSGTRRVGSSPHSRQPSPVTTPVWESVRIGTGAVREWASARSSGALAGLGRCSRPCPIRAR